MEVNLADQILAEKKSKPCGYLAVCLLELHVLKDSTGHLSLLRKTPFERLINILAYINLKTSHESIYSKVSYIKKKRNRLKCVA